MAEIKIYGTLVNATTDPKIAKASQIFDEELNKCQSEINTQLGISDDSLHKELTNFKNTKGKANGLASLDDSGKVPSTQLPSYVDDVLEFTQLDQLPKPGESGKIYVVTSTNLQYRWSGSDYVEISKSLALGETSSTAYPGDKGKATTDVVNSLSDNLVNDVLVSQSDKNSVSLTIKSITKNPVKKNKELLLVDGEPILLTDNTPILLADNVNDGLYDQADDKLITINQASSFTAGVMSASDKTKLDGLKAQAEIDTSISNVQNNLNAHINNRTNPHRVTKEQIGLDQVDNTSDANKPISNATQTALNGKFSATDGNALKQTIEDMPNFVVTEGSVSHKNNNISLSLRQQDLKDPVNTDSILLTFNPATDSTAGIVLPSDKNKIDKIITNGNGTKYLSDNGTYKEVSNAKNLIIPDVKTIVRPVSLQGQDAQSKINELFSSAGNFKDVVEDMLVNHTRYYFHFDNKLTNCIELGCVNPWRNDARTSYELHFIVVYNTDNNTYYTSKVSVIYDTDINNTKYHVTNLIQSDNDLLSEIKNLQIVHDNEFNFANDSIGNYVWINYRSRYDAVTSAKSVYVGNGQAGADGAFGAIRASDFFKESDVRLKSNIVPLNHTLDQICNIPTVEFDMHDKHQIGTIAQDLENNFAEVVDTDSDGMKFVDYCMLGVVAIEGIKLLKQEVEDLKKQIEELKNGKQNN